MKANRKFLCVLLVCALLLSGCGPATEPQTQPTKPEATTSPVLPDVPTEPSVPATQPTEPSVPVRQPSLQNLKRFLCKALPFLHLKPPSVLWRKCRSLLRSSRKMRMF